MCDYLPHTIFRFCPIDFQLKISLPNFAFFNIKLPSVTQRSVSQEKDFKKNKNPSASFRNTVGSNNSYGLTMIFAGQKNPFIIFRSKEMYIYFKTNNKIPINLLKKWRKTGFLVIFILEGTLTVSFNFLKFQFYYVWCIWKKRKWFLRIEKYYIYTYTQPLKMVKFTTEV